MSKKTSINFDYVQLHNLTRRIGTPVRAQTALEFDERIEVWG
jgi:hypothetical protein